MRVLRGRRRARRASARRELRVLRDRRGIRGHSQNLALFEAGEGTFLQRVSETLSSNQTTLHHIALNIDLEDYESELTRLQGLGLDVRSTEHPWLHVRSLYFHDPEGNTLELVCYDEQVG